MLEPVSAVSVTCGAHLQLEQPEGLQLGGSAPKVAVGWVGACLRSAPSPAGDIGDKEQAVPLWGRGEIMFELSSKKKKIKNFDF